MAASIFTTPCLVLIFGLYLLNKDRQGDTLASNTTNNNLEFLFSYRNAIFRPNEAVFLRCIARANRVGERVSKSKLLYSLLLLCGDVQANPGPDDITSLSTSTGRFKCGLCRTNVSWIDQGLCCDNCGLWFHIACQNDDYQQTSDTSRVAWVCSSCDCPNFSTVLSYHSINLSNSFEPLCDLDTTIASSLETPVSPGIPLATSSPSAYRSNTSQRRNRSQPIRLLNMNSQSIRNKKAEFCNLVDSTLPDIIVCTESWLNSDITNGELFPPTMSKQYNVFRRDREHSTGGGVFIAVSSEYLCTRERHLETECENLWIKINIIGCKSLYVCAFYNPHEGNETSLLNFEQSIRNLANNPTSHHIWIAGDMNFPGFDWQNNCLKPNCSYPELTTRFVDLLHDSGLTQIVTEPTRGPNTLDLFITNNESLINKIKIIPGLSDHDIVYVEADIHPIIHKQKPRKFFLYNKADWEGLRHHMANFNKSFTKISMLDPHLTTNQLWDTFKSELNKSIDKYIPTKTTNRKNGLPYVNTEIKRLIKKRDKLHSKKDPRYKDIKHLVQKKLRAAYWSYVEEVITPTDNNDISRSNKRFWSLIKHSKSDSTGIPPLKKQGLSVTDPVAKASLLNDTFYSAFSRTPANSNMPHDTCSPYPDMQNISIHTEGVFKLLKNLKPHKAAGPDGIRPRVLKELASVIAPMLQVIFQKSLTTHSVPDDWKKANITPIFKKGDKDCPTNYRPISLTCICSKILEHIITSNLVSHLDHYNILYQLQHGFRRGRSCESQLLELTTALQSNLSGRKQTDLIIMDFSKAFDKVCHQKLLAKLDYYGIRNDTLQWIRGFLLGRQQRVVIDGDQSSYLPVLSGVPQGSVIGPILFLIYINDLPNYVQSHIHLFADDTIMHLTIHRQDDCDQLQSDLDNLQVWEQDWMMDFNPDKCEVLRITRKKSTFYKNYTLHDQILNSVSSSKYLGVHLSKELKWNTHINKVTASANRTLGFLKRNLRVKSPILKEKAYTGLVRPQLEYCCTIWDPRHGVENNGTYKVEMVQRRAARWTLSRYNPLDSVTEMLEGLNWRSLQLRRADARLTLLYKITNQLIAVDAKTQLHPVTRRTRHNHAYSFIPLATKTSSHKLSFFPRTITQWNNLPPDTFNSCNSPDSFRNRVSALSHIPVF